MNGTVAERGKKIALVLFCCAATFSALGAGNVRAPKALVIMLHGQWTFYAATRGAYRHPFVGDEEVRHIYEAGLAGKEISSLITQTQQ